MMAPASYLLPLFVVLIHLGSLAPSTSYAAASSCHPDHAAALLQFKRSFLFEYSTNTLPSWFPGTDCCLWEGVRCDNVSGQVTALDLNGRGLYSYSLDGALFNLTSLQRLDLSKNDFGGSRIPAVGFEKLSLLTHLNISYAGFFGQIPIAIGKLPNLVSLDISCIHNVDGYFPDTNYNVVDSYNLLHLHEPSLDTLLSNLTDLRELYLDGVTIDSGRENWGTTLGKSVPHLEFLSMENCKLVGPIPESMSALRSIQVVKLKSNTISGVVPKFFGDFLNLTVLQLSHNNLIGSFPPEIFQLKNLGVLDVSWNFQLSGHVPKFPYGSSLETLNLQGTLFFGVTLSCFGNLTSLTDLGIDGSSVSTEPPYSFVNKLDHINTLRLSSTNLSWEAGSNFSWIGDLQSLTTLKITDCYFSKTAMRGRKTLTSWIGNLTDLRSLDIRFCEFVEPIPQSIGNLTTLEYLAISFSGFSGHLLSSVSNLKKLRFLRMSQSENALSVPITPAIGHLNKLEVLILGDCGFSGRIPNTIANMTKLISLDLSENYLVGDVPPFLFTLPLLLELDLSSNELSGPIQEFSSSRMESVILSENEFSGNIPSSLFELINLAILDLSSNNLTGLVDLDSFWKLRKLAELSLSDNKLYIKDGKGSNSPFPLLPKLSELELKSCSMTEVPSFLVHIDHISSLDLSCNKISGTIPNWIWQSWDSLMELNLSNNAFTDLQLTSYVLPNSRLESLDLSSNRIQGQIPVPNMLASSSDQVLDYSNNRFTSVMFNFTLYLSQTVYLKISNNGITGYVPHSLCNLSKLKVLDLANNNYRGQIPSCLIEDGSLSVLNLRGNHFEGELPRNINSKCYLQQIDINGNNIEGQLPRALSKCTDLEILDVGNNKIVDVFPSWLGNLSNLRILVLRSNQFYGTLDDPFRSEKFQEYFSRIQIIDIASNNFSGNLKPQWINMFKSMMENLNNTGQILGNSDTQYYQYTVTIAAKGQYITFDRILTALTAVDFSNNKLNGSIPDLVGNLVSLHILNMSHNVLTGNIPPQLGKLNQLESLDLSWNHFSGEIPQELANLTFLETLDLSNNNLEGKIPRSGQFGTFENSSFEGNTGLCGAPLSKQCVRSPQPQKLQQKEAQDLVHLTLFMFVGLGFGLGFAAAILITCP